MLLFSWCLNPGGQASVGASRTSPYPLVQFVHRCLHRPARPRSYNPPISLYGHPSSVSGSHNIDIVKAGNVLASQCHAREGITCPIPAVPARVHEVGLCGTAREPVTTLSRFLIGL